MKRLALAWILAVTAVLLPPATAVPATVSLLRTEHARAADFEDGVMWFLLLGSDARPGTDVLLGNTDAIQLVGVDFDRDRGVALGIPRDFWVDVPSLDGFVRINEILGRRGGETLVRTVEALIGIRADYVATVGLEGFADLVDEIGGIQVHSPTRFNDPEHPLQVRRGVNAFDGPQAAMFARVRKPFSGPGDLQRASNHQLLLRSIVRQLASRADEVAVMESGTLAALAALDTNLSLGELYRLGRAISQLDPSRVAGCVLTGRRLITSGGADVLEPNGRQIRRVAGDVATDAVLDGPC